MYADEGKNHESYEREIIHDVLSKGIRNVVNARISQKLDGGVWSKHRDFMYSKQTEDIECSLTNIFNVIPRHKTVPTLLKKAVLARGQYSYDIELVQKLIQYLIFNTSVIRY